MSKPGKHSYIVKYTDDMDEELFSFHTCAIDARDEELPSLTNEKKSVVQLKKEDSVFDDWTADIDFAIT